MVSGVSFSNLKIKMLMKKLNIGLVGYGFMGRAHSNAYLSVSQFFDIKYQPVLKAVAARNPEKVKAEVKYSWLSAA